MCFTGKNILIVEDTASIALFLKANLTNAGLLVETAATAKEALARFENSNGSKPGIDLMIVDLNLPDGDGAKLISRLACYQDSPPCFAMSADGSPEARARAMAAGAQEFFEKPFDIARLKKRLKATVHRADVTTKHNSVSIDLSTEEKRLTGDYAIFLEELADDMAVPKSFEKLASLLHQVRGSAALYGFLRLSSATKKLALHLKAEGPRAAEFVRLQFRIILLDTTNSRG